MVVAADVSIREAAEVLRRFLQAEISLSSLQPVLELAAKLNPDLETCEQCFRVVRPPASGRICRRCRERLLDIR
jgi:hypothetical protein